MSGVCVEVKVQKHPSEEVRLQGDFWLQIYLKFLFLIRLQIVITTNLDGMEKKTRDFLISPLVPENIRKLLVI